MAYLQKNTVSESGKMRNILIFQRHISSSLVGNLLQLQFYAFLYFSTSSSNSLTSDKNRRPKDPRFWENDGTFTCAI